MSAQRLELHQPPFTVLRVHAEGRPDQHRCGNAPEADTDPLVHACHVHDDEHHEQGKQPSGEDEQVLALEPLELRTTADSLVDRILRHITGRMSLNITATAGWTNGSGITVSNPGQFMFQALASLAQPIFNNGKLIANLKVTKAEEEIAKMNYQQTILSAGQEVSDALHLYDACNNKLIEDKARIEQLEKAVVYTKDLFQSGSATYLEILTSQQSLLSAQLAEVSDNIQRIQAVINLYSALGGGRE